MACVHLFELPLQVLMQRQPELRSHPAVVVSEDKPQGLILWANEPARARHISRGMRYSAGLSLDGNLRAGVIEAAELQEAEQRVLQTLRRFSPHIQVMEPGLFLVDASGLQLVFESLDVWSRQLEQALRDQGFQISLTVGFVRFHCLAIAKARSYAHREVLHDPEAERALAYRVPLERLVDDLKTHTTLRKLGVQTVGQLLALPPGGLKSRFGPDLLRLFQLAAETRTEPLAAVKEVTATTAELALDEGESDTERLAFLLRRLLTPLFVRLADRAQALRQLTVDLSLERSSPISLQVSPAQPTLDDVIVCDLLRLRLSATTLPSAVRHLRLNVEGVPAEQQQLSMFEKAHKRDLRAAERALSRLRAEFGDQAVQVATLREGHLPEAQFSWCPINKLSTPTPTRVMAQQIIRRLMPKALPLPARQRIEPDGWLVAGFAAGAVTQQHGPYVVSGGWWNREIRRDYYYLEVKRGDWLWVYFDHHTQRWLQAGSLA